jgi:hypothetical protein
MNTAPTDREVLTCPRHFDRTFVLSDDVGLNHVACLVVATFDRSNQGNRLTVKKACTLPYYVTVTHVFSFQVVSVKPDIGVILSLY